MSIDKEIANLSRNPKEFPKSNVRPKKLLDILEAKAYYEAPCDALEEDEHGQNINNKNIVQSQNILI